MDGSARKRGFPEEKYRGGGVFDSVEMRKFESSSFELFKSQFNRAALEPCWFFVLGFGNLCRTRELDR